MATSTLRISGRNWIHESGVTLAGGSWQLPIANVIDSRPGIYAEATDNTTPSTLFTVNLGVARRIDLIFFAYLKTRNDGAITIEIGNDPSFGVDLHLINGETTWPQDNTVTDNWGNTTIGTYLDLTYQAMNYPRFFPLASTVSAQYIRVSINNSSDPELTRIGCFGACELASTDFAFNWNMTFLDESIETLAVSGSAYYDLRRRKRRLNVAPVPMAEATAYGRFFDLLAYKGQKEPFVILPFGEAAYETRLEKVGLYGRRSSAPSFSNPFTTYYNMGFQVDEL